MIPAGVAHKMVADSGFRCVGGYVDGTWPDERLGKPEDWPEVEENIRKV